MADEREKSTVNFTFPRFFSVVLGVEMELENCYLSKAITPCLTLTAVTFYFTCSIASTKYNESFSVGYSRKMAVC